MTTFAKTLAQQAVSSTLEERNVPFALQAA